MGKTIGKSRVFAKHTTGTGGGGGGASITYTDVTLAQAKLNQANTGTNEWTDGYYKVGPIGTAAAYYYARTMPISTTGTLQLEEYGIAEFEPQLLITGRPLQGLARLNFTTGVIDSYEVNYQAVGGYVNQKIASTTGTSVLDGFLYLWGNVDYNRIDLINPTITFGAGTSNIGPLLQDIQGSSGDTFAFTDSAQGIVGLNEGSGRTISFAAAPSLYYINCIIQSGKTITINSSQSGKYWVDTRSTFMETLDIDANYDGGTFTLNLASVQHAGLIIMNSPTATSPTIKDFSNWLYDGMIKTFQVDGTTNPSFETGPLLFPASSTISSPFTLVGTEDLAVISFFNTKFIIMADSNTY